MHEKCGSGWTCTGATAKTFYSMLIQPEILELLNKFAKHNPGKAFHFTLLPNNEQKYKHELPPWNVFFNYDEVK